MSDVAAIIKTAHELMSANEDVPITVDSRGLGMAYAIPNGTEGTVVSSYAPWHAAELRQVFYQESAVLRSVLAEIQLVMSWRCSDASQYIIEAYLDKNIISLDPTVSVSISVRFNQPNPLSTDLESYEIPFTVLVDYRPVGSNSTTRYQGVLRADRTGRFDQV